MAKKQLSLSVFFLILANEGVDSIAQVLMKKGLPLSQTNPLDIHGVVRFVVNSASSHFVQSGVLVYASNFFIWIVILAQLDLSTAVPLTSVNYAILPVLAMFILHEKISFLRWVGISFIVFGIYWVSKSKSLQTESLKPG